MKRSVVYTAILLAMLLFACGSQERHAQKKVKHAKTGKVDTGCHCEVWN